MSTGPALLIRDGARCVCVVSTVRRTFRSRRRHSGSRRTAGSAATRPPKSDTTKNIYAQPVVALAEPYRVDGDPVSSRHESEDDMFQVETRPGRPLTITTRVTIVCDGHVYAEMSRGWPNLDAALVGLRDQTEDFTAKIVSDILKAHTPESFIAAKKARDAAPLPPQ